MEGTTLIFPVLGDPIDCILLGMKKRGFGQGYWNGFGGKIKKGESPEDAALRELYEEVGLSASPKDLHLIGKIDFVFAGDPNLDHPVDIFLLWNWSGKPTETSEMSPKWFSVNEIPFEQMWEDDIYWFPYLLKKAFFKGFCEFGLKKELKNFYFDKSISEKE